MQTDIAKRSRAIVASSFAGFILGSVVILASLYSYSRATGTDPFASQHTQLVTADFPTTDLSGQGVPVVLFTQRFANQKDGTIQVTSLYGVDLFNTNTDQVSIGREDVADVDCKLLLDGGQIRESGQLVYEHGHLGHMVGMAATLPLRAGTHALSLSCSRLLTNQSDSLEINSFGTDIVIAY